MDTRGATGEYRFRQWAKMVQERENSGLTIKMYCESIGIREHVYYHRLKKLREAACGELTRVKDNTAGLVPHGFTEIKLQRQPAMTLPSSSVQNHVFIEAGGMRIIVSCEYLVAEIG